MTTINHTHESLVSLILAVALLLTASARAAAQVEHVIDRTRPCECRIVVQRVAEVGVNAGEKLTSGERESSSPR